MTCEDLANMGAAQVRRISHNAMDCIEKSATSVVEFHFYQYVAPVLRAQGIAIPELIGCDAATRTLILEYIPHPLAQAQLRERTDVLATISRIHRIPVNINWTFKSHRWVPEKTDLALNMLQLPQQSAAIFRDIARLSSRLFNSNTLISGDTNAGNWGIREQGELVLYDWERFSVGNPVIDLAPLVKGMGSAADFIDISERYQQFSPSCNPQQLAQDMAICKLWVVTEVIDILHTNQKSSLNQYLDWYRSTLPDWLLEMNAFLNR